jgi:small-conductance mechanosensitive channel
VTGDVIDIGLVRIYLMELAGAGGDRHVTGRIVVFSNSVLFQPSALFKQMPGTEYVWRTVTLTLTPESDYQLAESRLMEAVDSVYRDYQESIERQHAAFERSVDVKVSAPHPEGRLRLSDAGLEFSARYPAEMRSAATIDDRVIRALYEAIANEPKLALAPSGAPKVLES